MNLRLIVLAAVSCLSASGAPASSTAPNVLIVLPPSGKPDKQELFCLRMESLWSYMKFGSILFEPISLFLGQDTTRDLTPEVYEKLNGAKPSAGSDGAPKDLVHDSCPALAGLVKELTAVLGPAISGDLDMETSATFVKEIVDRRIKVIDGSAIEGIDPESLKEQMAETSVITKSGIFVPGCYVKNLDEDNKDDDDEKDSGSRFGLSVKKDGSSSVEEIELPMGDKYKFKMPRKVVSENAPKDDPLCGSCLQKAFDANDLNSVFPADELLGALKMLVNATNADKETEGKKQTLGEIVAHALGTFTKLLDDEVIDAEKPLQEESSSSITTSGPLNNDEEQTEEPPSILEKAATLIEMVRDGIINSDEDNSGNRLHAAVNSYLKDLKCI